MAKSQKERIMNKLKIDWLAPIYMPDRKHKNDAGMDTYVRGNYIIKPHTTLKVPLGIKIKLPKKYMAQVIERSSEAVNGLILAKAPIDSGYTGEIHAIVTNTSNKNIPLYDGYGIGQLVVTKIATPIPWSVDLSDVKTERGDNGFGSTNKRQK